MPFTTATDALSFIEAGNAIVTLRSVRTGAHFTYKFKKAEPISERDTRNMFFVSLLAGPDNEGDYRYLGTREAGKRWVKLTTKSCVRVDAPSYKALTWALDHLIERGTIPPELEIRHEGRCGRCSRLLTHPESVDRGIGPECWEKGGH